MQHIKHIIQASPILQRRHIGSSPTPELLEAIGSEELAPPRAVLVAPGADGRLVVVDVVDYERPIDFDVVGPMQVVK